MVPPIVTVKGTSIYFLDYFAPVLSHLAASSVASSYDSDSLRGLLVCAACHHRPVAATRSGGLAVNDFRAFLDVAAMLQWSLTIDWTPDHAVN